VCCMCVAELIIKERSYFLGDPSKTELMRLIRCFGTHIIPIHIKWSPPRGFPFIKFCLRTACTLKVCINFVLFCFYFILYYVTEHKWCSAERRTEGLRN
jgi:hypothetical protein